MKEREKLLRDELYVMIMLQRSAEGGAGVDCDDPVVALACLDPELDAYKECPAACREDASKDDEKEDEVVKSGSLDIEVTDYSSAVKSVPMQGTVVFNEVKFKSSEKVSIESVKLARTGLSDKSAVKGVWFEKDGVAVSAKASLTSDGTVNTRFYNNYSVNGSDTLDLVVELNAATAGAEIAFKFVDATTSAEDVSLDAETSTYRTTNYKVAEVAYAAQTTPTTEYKIGEAETFEIGKFNLTNNKQGSEDKDVVIKSLKLKNIGTMDLGESLKDVVVKRDSKVVSKKVELNNKELIIYFDDEELASGKKGVYTIFAEIAQLNETNKTVQLELNKESDLVANEKASNFRVSVPAASKGVTLGIYTFKGGKVTLTNDASMAKTVNAAAGSSDVVVAKGKLTISEPVKLGKITIVSNEAIAPTVPVGATAAESNMVKDLKVEIGGSTYYTTATCTAGATTNSCTYVTDDDEIYVSKTSDIRVLLDIKNYNSNSETISFAGYFNGASIEKSTGVAGVYDNSNEDNLNQSEIAGSIQYAKVTVKAGKLNLTNKSSSTQKVVINSADEVSIFNGEISVKDGTVSVNEIVVNAPAYSAATGGSYGFAATDALDLTLYVNGESFSTISFRGSETPVASKSFNSLGEVSSDEPMKVEIKAQPTISVAGNVVFTIKAKGSDAQGNNVESTNITTAKLEVTGKAEASIATSSASSTIVKDGSDAELLSFSTTIKNGSYDLSKVVVTTDLATTVNATLAIDGTDVDTANPAAGALTFNNINETLAVGSHTLTVKANLSTENGSVVNVTNVDLYDETNIVNGTKAFTVKKLVAKAYPVISASTSSDDLILKITNPADNDENITIKGFTVTNSDRIVTASLDGALDVSTTKSLNEAVAAKAVSIAPDSYVELRVQADKGYTLQVTAIAIEVDGDVIVIDSNYKNVGTWESFKVTASGDKSGAATSATNAALLSASGLPAGATFVDNGDGTATLTFTADLTNNATSSVAAVATVSSAKNNLTVTAVKAGTTEIKDGTTTVATVTVNM